MFCFNGGHFVSFHVYDVHLIRQFVCFCVSGIYYYALMSVNFQSTLIHWVEIQIGNTRYHILFAIFRNIQFPVQSNLCLLT